MTKTPFLDRFRLPASSDPASGEEEEELFYCLDRKLNVTREGHVVWSSLSRKYPTNCHTKGRMRKGGYTRGKKPKYKPAKYVPGKTDRRSGK